MSWRTVIRIHVQDVAPVLVSPKGKGDLPQYAKESCSFAFSAKERQWDVPQRSRQILQSVKNSMASSSSLPRSPGGGICGGGVTVGTVIQQASATVTPGFDPKETVRRCCGRGVGRSPSRHERATGLEVYIVSRSFIPALWDSLLID